MKPALAVWEIKVYFLKKVTSDPLSWFRLLVAGLSPRVRVQSQAIHVGCVMGKVELEQTFLRVLRFSPVSISPLGLRVHSFIYYRCYIIQQLTVSLNNTQKHRCTGELVYVKGPWKKIMPDTWVHTEIQTYCGFVLLCYDVDWIQKFVILC
jgi:hypothetical protein